MSAGSPAPQPLAIGNINIDYPLSDGDSHPVVNGKIEAYGSSGGGDLVAVYGKVWPEDKPLANIGEKPWYEAPVTQGQVTHPSGTWRIDAIPGAQVGVTNTLAVWGDFQGSCYGRARRTFVGVAGSGGGSAGPPGGGGSVSALLTSAPRFYRVSAVIDPMTPAGLSPQLRFAEELDHQALLLELDDSNGLQQPCWRTAAPLSNGNNCRLVVRKVQGTLQAELTVDVLQNGDPAATAAWKATAWSVFEANRLQLDARQQFPQLPVTLIAEPA